MQNNIKVGERVIIQNSMLYTGRIGTLEEVPSTLGVDVGGQWDFHVRLDSVEDDRIKDRVIGVYDFQARLIKE